MQLDLHIFLVDKLQLVFHFYNISFHFVVQHCLGSQGCKKKRDKEHCIPQLLKDYITQIRKIRLLDEAQPEVSPDNRIDLSGQVGGWTPFWDITQKTAGEIYCEFYRGSFELLDEDIVKLTEVFQSTKDEDQISAVHCGPLPEDMKSVEFKNIVDTVLNISAPSCTMLTWCYIENSIMVLDQLWKSFGKQNVQHVVWVDSKYPKGCRINKFCDLKLNFQVLAEMVALRMTQ